jgi:hypothetical protein
MKEMTPDGVSKMEAAKQVVTRFIRDIPDGKRLTFIVYGVTPYNRQQESCQDVRVIQQLGPVDGRVKDRLEQYIAGIRPHGATPLAQSLRVAGLQLAGRKGMCQVVLITDGMETCGGDPARVAAELNRDLNLPHGVDVVGLGVAPKEKRALQDIVSKGKGHFYDAHTARELGEAMARMGREAQEQARRAAQRTRDAAARAEAEERARRKAEEDRLALEERARRKAEEGRRKAEEDRLAMIEAEEARKAREAERQRREEEERIRLAEQTDDPFVQVLIEHLKDEDANVRAQAGYVLQKMGNRPAARAAIPALTRLILENHDGDWVDYRSNKSAALGALQVLAPEKVKPMLLQAARSKHAGVKQWATAKLTQDVER